MPPPPQYERQSPPPPERPEPRLPHAHASRLPAGSAAAPPSCKMRRGRPRLEQAPHADGPLRMAHSAPLAFRWSSFPRNGRCAGSPGGSDRRCMRPRKRRMRIPRTLQTLQEACANRETEQTEKQRSTPFSYPCERADSPCVGSEKRTPQQAAPAQVEGHLSRDREAQEQ